MTTLVIDITVIAIVAFCGWRGYKNGLIRGVFGVVALIISLLLANIAAQAYSQEFTEMLKPFVSGILETTLAEVDDADDDEDEVEVEVEFDDLAFDNGSEEFGRAYRALRSIGLPKPAARHIADITTRIDDEDDNGGPTDTEDDSGPRVQLSDLIADNLSDILAYVAVFAIAFVLLAIVFAVIGNLISLVFSLPGLKYLDIIAGSIFGIVKGLIIVLTFGAILRYYGLLALDILERTSVLNYIVNNNPIADMLGI